MKIFLTGHRGKLGSRILKELGDHDVVTYDLKDGEDIADCDKLRQKMYGCDCVIHAAAIPHPHKGSIADYFRVNIQGSFNVMEVAREVGVKRFIFLSSVGYYGANIQGKLLPLYLPIDEGHPPASMQGRSVGIIDAYNQSKVVCEELLAWYGRNKHFEAITLRIGATVPKAKMFKSGWDKKKDVYRRGSFWASCNPDYVSEAVKLAVENNRSFSYEAFNIVDKYAPKCIDIKQFLDKEYPGVRLDEEIFQGDKVLSLISPVKAERILGFRPCEEM